MIVGFNHLLLVIVRLVIVRCREEGVREGGRGEPYLAPAVAAYYGQVDAVKELLKVDADGAAAAREIARARGQGAVYDYLDRMAEAAAASADADTPLIGAEVQLHDLRSKPELNGQRGRVERYDSATQRYVVRLDRVEDPVALLSRNLERISAKHELKSHLVGAIIGAHEVKGVLNALRAISSWVRPEEEADGEGGHLDARYTKHSDGTAPEAIRPMLTRRMTLLMLTARSGQLDVLSWLLKQGPQVELRDAYAWTALMHAASSDVAGCVMMLAGAGAALDLTADGCSALMHAARDGHLKSVQACLGIYGTPGASYLTLSRIPKP